MLRLIFVWLFYTNALFAQPTLEVEGELVGPSIKSYFTYFVDETAALTIEDISSPGYLARFFTLNKASASFGFIGSKAVWARLIIDNKEAQGKTVLFEHRYAVTDFVAFYYKDADQKWKHRVAGDHVRFDTRDIKFRYPVFEHEIPPGVSEIYFKIQTSGSLGFPFLLWSKGSFYDYSLLSMGIACFIFGGLILLFGYNLFLTMFLVDRCYVFYLLYLISMITFQLADTGLGQQIFEPTASYSWISNQGLAIAMDSCSVTAILFTIYFLNVKKNLRVGYYIMCAFTVGFFLNIFNSTFLSYTHGIRLAVSALIFSSSTLLICGIILSIKRVQSANFFTLAWTCLLLGNIFTISARAGVIPQSSFTEWTQFLGAGIEAMFLSLALGDRVNAEKKQKYLDIVREKNKNLHLLSQLTNMVYPHQVKIMNDGLSIIDTMPIGESFAVVISLDIVDSSKIGHTENHEFFETVLKKCHEVMTRNYHPETMSANAYMIKEMGDGFICSVGFPFKVEGNVYDHSLKLAAQFVEVFDQTVRSCLKGGNAACAVGIACGTVTGFFPINGLKNYDLYGEAIVKSKRYEAFRSILFEQLSLEKQTVIIVQDKVFQNLSPELSQTLSEFNLAKAKVRDDAQAAVVYYRLMGKKRSEYLDVG